MANNKIKIQRLGIFDSFNSYELKILSFPLSLGARR